MSVSGSNEAAHEITRRFGRVYQTDSKKGRIEIDWIPPSPILGRTRLTRGQAVFHPIEGKVVRFPQAIRRRRGTATIVVRTGERPDLLELFELAIDMEADLSSDIGACATGPAGDVQQQSKPPSLECRPPRSLPYLDRSFATGHVRRSTTFRHSARSTPGTPRVSTIWSRCCRRKSSEFVMLEGHGRCVLPPSR